MQAHANRMLNGPHPNMCAQSKTHAQVLCQNPTLALQESQAKGVCSCRPGFRTYKQQPARSKAGCAVG